MQKCQTITVIQEAKLDLCSVYHIAKSMAALNLHYDDLFSRKNLENAPTIRGYLPYITKATTAWLSYGQGTQLHVFDVRYQIYTFSLLLSVHTQKCLHFSPIPCRPP